MTVDQGVDISPAGDRGVLKKILTEGRGTETAKAGYQVTVHYTGTLLDGTKFDSSKDRDEPFDFHLGGGVVIKAWDIGVATMKKGEVCVLTCAPEYAYGKNGSPPKIPPNSTLQFEIELIDWELEDISPDLNKAILRSSIEKGEEDYMPTQGALINVELEGRFQDGKVFDSRTVSFCLGEGVEYNICEGLELALEKFTKGEKSNLIIQPKYAFKDGHKEFNIPPDTVIEYTVKLLDVSKCNWDMTAEQNVEESKKWKDKGTTYFQKGKYPMAVKMYLLGLKFIDKIPENKSESEQCRNEAQTLIVSFNLNISMCYLKYTPSQNFEAVKHATDALFYEPNNVKGLFRRGQAYLGLNDGEKALQDFLKVAEIEPSNKAVASQIAASRAAIKAQKLKERQMYSNMFDKFAQQDIKRENLKPKHDVIGDKVGEWGAGEGEWTAQERDREPTTFEKENPNILMLDKDGQFQNM